MRWPAAENTAGSLTVKVLRAEPAEPEPDTGVVRALDLRGLPLGEARYAFKSGERETDAVIDLPVEIRNDVARMEIAGERSAGVVQLLDKRWRRRTIGIVSGASVETAQPLLASTFYLSRALGPFADVRLAEPVAPAEARQALPRPEPADARFLPTSAMSAMRVTVSRAGSRTAASWSALPARASPPPMTNSCR